LYLTKTPVENKLFEITYQTALHKACYKAGMRDECVKENNSFEHAMSTCQINESDESQSIMGKDTMINSDALMANCSHDWREQMIEEQMEKMNPFNIQDPKHIDQDQTQDPKFIKQLTKDIMGFWE
jgi:hypothetical protein